MNLIQGQKHQIGFAFRDQKHAYLNCSFCNLNEQDNAKLIEIYDQMSDLDINEYKEILLKSISKENSDDLNGRLLLNLFDELGESTHDCSWEDSLIYNISNPWSENYGDDNSFAFNEQKGTLYMINLMNKCISYAKDPQTIYSLKINRFKYLSQSGVLEKLDKDPLDFLSYYEEKLSEKNSSFEDEILKTYIGDKLTLYDVLKQKEMKIKFSGDYNKQNENDIDYYQIDKATAPFEYFRNYYIAPGVGYSYGKDQWISAELSFGLRDREMPYKLDLGSFRNNLLNIGINYNLNSNSKEFLISAFVNKTQYLLLNVVQFGIHDSQLASFKKSFFYRPKIGFQYGYFDISYSYNLTFNKEIRPLTEKHLLSIGVSYPLIRVGKYFNPWLNY